MHNTTAREPGCVGAPFPPFVCVCAGAGSSALRTCGPDLLGHVRAARKALQGGRLQHRARGVAHRHLAPAGKPRVQPQHHSALPPGPPRIATVRDGGIGFRARLCKAQGNHYLGFRVLGLGFGVYPKPLNSSMKSGEHASQRRHRTAHPVRLLSLSLRKTVKMSQTVRYHGGWEDRSQVENCSQVKGDLLVSMDV